MTAALPELAGFDVERFLRDTWQKRPLLIRNTWPEWTNPLEPDELAGLACEAGVESRLVTHSETGWELEHGPLSEDRFGRMGRAPWTLLVQAVDHHVPAVAALIEPFRFVPNWRVDDVMVSYAVDGGGVGPHFDQYDVFLLQGLGRRRWQVGGLCDQATPLLPHEDAQLLADFTPTEEWVLEPGDMLYLPPRIAHKGVALGDDCMTYSIGFRAPSRSELIGGWADSVLAALDDDDRYGDPHLQVPENPGELPAEAIDRLHAMVAERMLDRAAFARWFAGYSTTPKYPEIDWRPQQPFTRADAQQALATGAALVRNPASRFAFIRSDPDTDAVVLFVDGQSYPCTGAAAGFARRLCAGERVQVDAQVPCSGAALGLIVDLLNTGSIGLDPED